jgi:hypothetical protein
MSGLPTKSEVQTLSEALDNAYIEIADVQREMAKWGNSHLAYLLVQARRAVDEALDIIERVQDHDCYVCADSDDTCPACLTARREAYAESQFDVGDGDPTEPSSKIREYEAPRGKLTPSQLIMANECGLFDRMEWEVWNNK